MGYCLKMKARTHDQALLGIYLNDHLAGSVTGRVKLNGRVLARSPSSRVLEFEAMRLGVEGKAAGWPTLRTRADTDHRLDTGRLDELNERARGQIDKLETLRVRAVAEVFDGRHGAVEVVRKR
jgi:hypothetical protein